MLRRLVLITLFFSGVANALPIAASEQFATGNYWVWNYYENGDRSKFYSSEKYLITDVASDLVTFEIWTKYAGKSTYTPNTRFVAYLADCRQAFASGGYRPFTIELYTYSNGKWSTAPYTMRSTAFEEKFNCNPIEYPTNHPEYSTLYDSVLTPWGHQRLFQQKAVSANQLLSFYFADHTQLAGIAYKKEFNASTPYEFEMELVEASLAFQKRNAHFLRRSATSAPELPLQ